MAVLLHTVHPYYLIARTEQLSKMPVTFIVSNKLLLLGRSSSSSSRTCCRWTIKKAINARTSSTDESLKLCGMYLRVGEDVVVVQPAYLYSLKFQSLLFSFTIYQRACIKHYAEGRRKCVCPSLSQ